MKSREKEIQKALGVLPLKEYVVTISNKPFRKDYVPPIELYHYRFTVKASSPRIAIKLGTAAWKKMDVAMLAGTVKITAKLCSNEDRINLFSFKGESPTEGIDDLE